MSSRVSRRYEKSPRMQPYPDPCCARAMLHALVDLSMRGRGYPCALSQAPASPQRLKSAKFGDWAQLRWYGPGVRAVKPAQHTRAITQTESQYLKFFRLSFICCAKTSNEKHAWRARKRISSDEGVSLTAKNCSSISSPASDSAAARGCCDDGCAAGMNGAWMSHGDALMAIYLRGQVGPT